MLLLHFSHEIKANQLINKYLSSTFSLTKLTLQPSWVKNVTSRFLYSLTETDVTNVSEQMCLKQKLARGIAMKQSSVSIVSCPS